MVPVSVVLVSAVAASAFVLGTVLDAVLRRIPRVEARLPPGRLPLAVAVVNGAVDAVVAGALTAREGPSATLGVLVLVIVVATYLCILDLRHRLLPNVVVVPAAVLGTALLLVSTAVDGRPESGVRAALGGLVLFAVYLLLALVSPGGLGMGDVKFAALIGAVLAYDGWRQLLVGAAAGFALAAVVGGALLVVRRARRGTAMPFGPMMLAGALIVLLGDA